MALGRISEREMLILNMYLDGRSCSHIATEIGVSPVRINQILHRLVRCIARHMNLSADVRNEWSSPLSKIRQRRYFWLRSAKAIFKKYHSPE